MFHTKIQKNCESILDGSVVINVVHNLFESNVILFSVVKRSGTLETLGIGAKSSW